MNLFEINEIKNDGKEKWNKRKIEEELFKKIFLTYFDTKIEKIPPSIKYKGPNEKEIDFVYIDNNSNLYFVEVETSSINPYYRNFDFLCNKKKNLIFEIVGCFLKNFSLDFKIFFIFFIDDDIKYDENIKFFELKQKMNKYEFEEIKKESIKLPNEYNSTKILETINNYENKVHSMSFFVKNFDNNIFYLPQIFLENINSVYHLIKKEKNINFWYKISGPGTGKTLFALILLKLILIKSEENEKCLFLTTSTNKKFFREINNSTFLKDQINQKKLIIKKYKGVHCINEDDKNCKYVIIDEFQRIFQYDYSFFKEWGKKSILIFWG